MEDKPQSTYMLNFPPFGRPIISEYQTLIFWELWSFLNSVIALHYQAQRVIHFNWETSLEDWCRRNEVACQLNRGGKARLQTFTNQHYEISPQLVCVSWALYQPLWLHVLWNSHQLELIIRTVMFSNTGPNRFSTHVYCSTKVWQSSNLGFPQTAESHIYSSYLRTKHNTHSFLEVHQSSPIRLSHSPIWVT